MRLIVLVVNIEKDFKGPLVFGLWLFDMSSEAVPVLFRDNRFNFSISRALASSASAPPPLVYFLSRLCSALGFRLSFFDPYSSLVLPLINTRTLNLRTLKCFPEGDGERRRTGGKSERAGRPNKSKRRS